MSDRLKLPPERDFGFYQRRKHDKWRAVEPPVLETVVADSHAHIHMLPDPAWELVRCAANGVDFICDICDPSEDGSRPFDEIDQWLANARSSLAAEAHREMHPYCAGSLNEWHDCHATHSRTVTTPDSTPGMSDMTVMPLIDARIAVGVHPHNAKLYTRAVEDDLVARLSDPHVVALGEIGLDYHYDLSPRDIQRQAFDEQLDMAYELHKPVILHIREAHGDATDMLTARMKAGRMPKGVMHCYTGSWESAKQYLNMGLYISFSGAVTFKNAPKLAEVAVNLPADRILVETDCPYMAPVPMRGKRNEPAFVVYTAAKIAQLRGEDEEAFALTALENGKRLFGV